MGMSLIGCTSTKQETSSAIQLTDQAGRQVNLKQPAQKIVSCYYITTCLLYTSGFKSS